MQFIAHRGDHRIYEENSIKAFKAAIKNTNYVGFELDIRETKDHHYVVNHGPIYQGKCIHLTNYNKLKSVLSLKKVLSLKTDKIILIEIKDFTINYDKLLKILCKSHLHIYIMSFYNHHIKKLNELINNPVGPLNYYLNKMNTNYYDFICLLSVTKKGLVKKYFNTGKEVFIYGYLSKKKHQYDFDVYLIVDEVF